MFKCPPGLPLFYINGDLYVDLGCSASLSSCLGACGPALNFLKRIFVYFYQDNVILGLRLCTDKATAQLCLLLTGFISFVLIFIVYTSSRRQIPIGTNLLEFLLIVFQNVRC